MLWPGPGGRDEPDDNGCDGDCSACRVEDCEERGVECADPETCADCTCYGCPARIEDNENQEGMDENV